MTSFSWPEPDFEFFAAILDPGDAQSNLYFVCYKGSVLQQFDADGSWCPIDDVTDFEGVSMHYMGVLGRAACYAVEVRDPMDRVFANLRTNLGNIRPVLFNLAGRAMQLCDWYKTHQYCGQCGQTTDIDSKDRAAVCANCKLRFYPRLSPSIIVLIHRGDEVLLGRNHLFPEGLFSTLAGFVEPGESIEETVRREVKEEVGVTVGELNYRGSQAWPFPNSLMLGFHAEYHSGDIVLQVDEIAEANWYPCDALPKIPGKFAISRWLIDDYLSSRGLPSP